MRARRLPHHRAISLVEVLMALSILAVLMIAMTQALSASFMAFRVNQTQAMLTIRSRAVLMRILDQIRANSKSDPYTQTTSAYTSYFNSGTAMDDIGISITEPQLDGITLIDYTYFWDAVNTQLKLTRAVYNNTNPLAPVLISTTTQALLHGVTNFKITMLPGQDDHPLQLTGKWDMLMRASIQITIQDTLTGAGTSTTNRQTVALSGSASPRQNVWTGVHLKNSIDTTVAQEAKYH